ncbi:FMRFamide receptor-like [Gigantopelta aegis]|uniref:FMRFamide receptor-like n=1 Tax=Gigantopelta aegis TaxID=1735272 RepID=UPI001B88CD3B|nr:FMRFamide receptor-like [Gigantopelta aegis]
MSTTNLQPSSLNQTTSFIETSTAFFNLTYGNHSAGGRELQRKSASSLGRWTDFEMYRYTFWSIVLFIVATGIIGNVLQFIMMGDTKLNHLSYSVYLKFLSVSDSLLLSINLLSETNKVFPIQYAIPVYIGILSFALRVLAGILSPWLVVGLTLDRYICICFPLKRQILCTKKKAIAVCSAMLVVSGVLLMPFPVSMGVVKNRCFPPEGITSYYNFILLLFSSILPCLFILVLNILIITQIQRSRYFRSSFTTSTASRPQDNSTRPLVLVSVLAFVTLVPVAVSKAVQISLEQLDRHLDGQALHQNVRTILFMIYLLNFGQNFYILIASSSNYREIIKRRLACCSLKWKLRRQQSQSVVTQSSHTSGSGSGSAGLSVASIRE